MKRLSTVCSLIAIAISIVACGGGNASQKKTITWLHFGAQQNLEQARQAEADIEKKYPDINIDIIAPSGRGGNSLMEKYLAMQAAGDAPDIATVRYSWIGDLVQRGALLEIDDLYESEKMESVLSQIYPPQIVDLSRFGEHYYAVPGWINPVVLHYNKDLMDEAGVPYLTKDTSFNDFIASARQFTRTMENMGGDIHEFGYAGEPVNFPVANGYSVLNKEGTAANIDNPGFYEWMLFARELMDEEVSPQYVARQSNPLEELFNTGRIMSLAHNHYMRRYFNDVDFEWDIIPMPLIDKENGYSGGSLVTIGFIGSSTTQYPEEVQNILFELVSGVYQEDMLTYISDMPVLRPLQTDPRYLNATERPEHSQYYVDALENSIADERYLTDEVQRAYWDALDIAFNPASEEREIIEGFKDSAKIMNELLEERRSQMADPYDNF